MLASTKKILQTIVKCFLKKRVKNGKNEMSKINSLAIPEDDILGRNININNSGYEYKFWT